MFISIASKVANIKAAMEEFNKHTCVRWIPRTNETNWILFVKKAGYVIFICTAVTKLCYYYEFRVK